jgi:gliding motility-associated-like protein
MDIDKLFKDVLRDKEINPSDAAWDKLSESLKQEMPSAESSSSSLEPQSVSSSIKAVVSKVVVATITVATVVIGSVMVINAIDDNKEAQIVSEPISEVFQEKTLLVVDNVEVESTAEDVNESSELVTQDFLAKDSRKMNDSEEPHTLVSNEYKNDNRESNSDTIVMITYNNKENVVNEEKMMKNVVESSFVDILDIPISQERVVDAVGEMEKDERDSVEKEDGQNNLVNVEIPNLVTPNNDNINDCWVILGIENYNNVHVVIFSGNQKIVYENRRYDNSWCANDLPEGTYYYLISIRSENYITKGALQIIKH